MLDLIIVEKGSFFMKRNLIFVLLVVNIFTLSSCGKEDISSENPIIVNQGTFIQDTEIISEENTQPDTINGYIVTTTTEINQSVPTEETTTITPDEISDTIQEETINTESPEDSNPSIIDYTPATATEGTPAYTAVLPADAPTELDYNYGPAPTVYNIPGIKYIDNVLIANKSYSLPADFYPELDQTCLTQFYKLQNDASAVGLNIYLSSGFRDYYTQDSIYNNYVAMDGQEIADTYSARAGFSEHQSGLAIDVNQIDDSFIGTPEAIWLEQHCYEYGFILRYPQNKQDITGYKYESWHIRYVGTDVSYKIHAKAIELNDPYLTLEEYFGIDSYYH